jgi:hypothetical protein
MVKNTKAVELYGTLICTYNLYGLCVDGRGKPRFPLSSNAVAPHLRTQTQVETALSRLTDLSAQERSLAGFWDKPTRKMHLAVVGIRVFTSALTLDGIALSPETIAQFASMEQTKVGLLAVGVKIDAWLKSIISGFSNLNGRVKSAAEIMLVS